MIDRVVVWVLMRKGYTPRGYQSTSAARGTIPDVRTGSTIPSRCGLRAVRHSGWARLCIVVAACLCLGAACQSTPDRTDGRTPVWIDTDVAIGEPDRDVSDAFAIIQALHSPGLDVRGVSAVFGNVPLVRTWPIAKDLVGRFGPEDVRAWRGAEGPHERQAPTEASEALAAALGAEPLTVIALGPLTNIASLLERKPALGRRITRIVAVAGRRPGQRFTTGAVNPRGHRDLNVELDVAALRVVLDSGVPLTLAPFELSSQVVVDASDLEALGEGPVAARFLAESSGPWLRLWQEVFAMDGFSPFDTLAVDLVASPDSIACMEARAVIEPWPADEIEPRLHGQFNAAREALIVRDAADAGERGRAVTYCHTPDEGFKARLMDALLR